MDMKKIIIRAIKDLNEPGGTSLKNIEKYIAQSHTVELVDDANLSHELKVSVKKEVNEGHIVKDGSLFKLEEDSDSTETVDVEEEFPPIMDMAAKDDKVQLN